MQLSLAIESMMDTLLLFLQLLGPKLQIYYYYYYFEYGD